MNSKNSRAPTLLFFLSAITLGTVAAKEPKPDGDIKGKFIGTYETSDNRVCKLFTRNLNEFRHLPFNACNPRLSPKFPEFSRPIWEEIPFDLALAEKVVKGGYGDLSRDYYSQQAALQWPSWRDRTEAFRRAGKAHMWRTLIDFDGDGKAKTIIRMLPAANVVDYRLPDKPMDPGYDTFPWNCDYNNGVLHMADDARREVMHSFNTHSYEGQDIIYFAGDKRYYRVDWNPSPPDYPRIQLDTGATAGVILSVLGMDGKVTYGGPHCRVDWVPAKKRRSVNPRTAK